MKKLVFAVWALSLVAAGFGCSPGYYTQEGALIGATLGAWAGQDLGRDTESTLIGASLGGLAGAVIGDALEQYESDYYYYSRNTYYDRYPQQNYSYPSSHYRRNDYPRRIIRPTRRYKIYSGHDSYRSCYDVIRITVY